MNDGNPRRNQGRRPATARMSCWRSSGVGHGAMSRSERWPSRTRRPTRATRPGRRYFQGASGNWPAGPDLHVPDPDSRPLQGEHVRREPRVLGGQVGVEPERYARRSAAHHGPAPAGSEVVRGRLLESRRLEAGPRRHRHSRQVGQAPDIARPEPGVPEDPSIEGDVSRGVVEKPAKPRDGDPLQLVGGPPLALAQLSQARAHPPTARPVEQREDYPMHEPAVAGGPSAGELSGGRRRQGRNSFV